MKLIRDIYAERRQQNRPVISFELFPPKSVDGERALLQKVVPSLKQLGPDYFSVTYGAGGGIQTRTLAIVDSIQRDHGVTGLAHLTCVNATRLQLTTALDEARKLGIRNILALRGDPPAGTSEWQQVEGGFNYAWQLVQLMREAGGFSIGVAGFPEGHIACKEGRLVDWQRLKDKIECGADFVITQLFFNNKDYFDFRDHLTALGVTAPLVPGIIPILSAAQIKRFTALCGADLPAPLLAGLEKLGDDDEAATQFGIDYATTQCDALLRNGAPGIHFYTLNKARSTTQILKNLGLA